jgi:quercetin dioxygenase-like cupin family protein
MQKNDWIPEQQMGSEARILVDGSDTGGRLAIVEIREARGEGSLCHRHLEEDVVIYVLEGDVTFDLVDRRIAGNDGTCMHLPAGTEHGYVVTSNEVRLLLVITPAGPEGLYREVSGIHKSDCVDLEHLVSLAARYGIEITGPVPPADS